MRRSSEWARTVLPAPVSPVITLSPSPRRNSARSIRSRLSIRNSCSMPPVKQRRPTDSPRGLAGGGRGALTRGDVLLANERERERRAGEGDHRRGDEDLVEAVDERRLRGGRDLGL